MEWKHLENQSNVFISAGTRAEHHPPHPAAHIQTLCTLEVVSLILWKSPKVQWCMDGLKSKRRGEGMMGGKMSSSFKSPYVNSLSSLVLLGFWDVQAQVWAGWPVRRTAALGWWASRLPLLSLLLLQGSFLLDASVDLLLKLAHLLLELTDEVYYALGGMEVKWEGGRRCEIVRWEERKRNKWKSSVKIGEERGEVDNQT